MGKLSISRGKVSLINKINMLNTTLNLFSTPYGGGGGREREKLNAE